jgi:hypothetical protein
MKSFTSFILFAFLFCQASFSQKLPGGHILQYQQGFSDGKSLSDFRFDNPASWGIFNVKGNYYLQCTGIADPAFRNVLPANIAILNNKIFGDFILEVDVMPEPDSNGFREVCLFLGMKDLTRYYYVQIACLGDSIQHGIYLVKNSVATRLTASSEKSVCWHNNNWHKIRLERNIVKRTILVFVDDMAHPAMQIKDYELVMGMVGVGSFASPGRFDNLKIWAPTVINDEGPACLPARQGAGNK